MARYLVKLTEDGGAEVIGTYRKADGTRAMVRAAANDMADLEKAMAGCVGLVQASRVAHTAVRNDTGKTERGTENG